MQVLEWRCWYAVAGLAFVECLHNGQDLATKTRLRKKHSTASSRNLELHSLFAKSNSRRHRILTEPYGSTKISAEVHTWPADLQAESGRTQDLRRGKRQSSWYPWRVTEEPRPSLAWLRPQTSRQTSQNPQMHGYLLTEWPGLEKCTLFANSWLQRVPSPVREDTLDPTGGLLRG